MSYQKFASSQDAPRKNDPTDKPKEASPAGEPTVQPDQKPAVIVPAPKA
ncbi:MAG TPA: hypothetical protein VIR45_09730 [Kiloniellaceae bacterium]